MAESKKPAEKKKPAAKKAAVLYWKNPQHIHEMGLQTGLVTPEAKKAFEKHAKETGSGAKLADWTTDHDVEAERDAEARRISDLRAGIPAKK